MLTAHADLLLSPEHWRLISSLFPPEAATVPGELHQAWLEQGEDIHPAREVLLVLEGNTHFSFQQAVYPATPGTVFLFDAFEQHVRLYPQDGSQGLHLWFYFLADQHVAVHLLALDNGQKRILRNWLLWENHALIQWFHQLWDQVRDPAWPPRHRRLQIQSILSLLMIETLRLEQEQPTTKNDAPAIQEITMRMVSRHISQTAGRGLSIDKLAHVAGYSKFHLTRLFRQHTGMSIHQAINQARYHRVAECTRNGLRAGQIAEQLGFSSHSAYAHWHRQHRDALDAVLRSPSPAVP